MRFALAVFSGGIAAGVVGAAMAWLFHLIHSLDGWWWALAGGGLAGLGWWWLRRDGPVRHIEDSLHTGAPLPLGRSLIDALLQILAVASGLSLGKEQAPRQGAAALMSTIAGWVRVTPEQRRLLVAASAGAGLAAVYNVPVAGFLFCVEVLPVRRSWRLLAAAGATSALATGISWLLLGRQPIYRFPALDFSWSILAWALLLVPLAALLGSAFLRLIAVAQEGATFDPRWLIVSIPAAIGVAVDISHLIPDLTGNGEEILQAAFTADSPWGLFLALLLLKPLLTALSLRAGAVGGTMTPSLAIGAALGGLAGSISGLDAPLIAAFALVGAAGVLAVVQRAPFFAAVIAWELTWAPWWILPILVAVAWAAHRLAVRISSTH
ncbi:H(+)/Cl(-) exchange transporter ClcA [Corynebacterium atrinae]|uniref:chloride channel protein n=1 Tax=Corynebacterium atrinae TaxID=1336740 RepID=UPI0025B36198|nr:chloride channel protein [Corynebacterium atrinae]WJY63011.1 H(+)/Cl(-) exchange transporter ClcA [Corynebacterium atrinae]